MLTSKTEDFIEGKRVFAWIGAVVALILCIPLIAMQLTDEVNWSIMDFAFMALLLFTTGSCYILVARKVHRKNRIVAGIVCGAICFYVWAELAVGIFFNLGS